MLASLSVCRDPTLSQEAKDVSIYHYVQPVLPEAPTTQECRAVHPPSTKLRVLRLCDSQNEQGDSGRAFLPRRQHIGPLTGW